LEKGLIEEYQKELGESEEKPKQRSYYYNNNNRITDKGRRFLQI
jgi:hypothetical protein